MSLGKESDLLGLTRNKDEGNRVGVSIHRGAAAFEKHIPTSLKREKCENFFGRRISIRSVASP